MCSFQNVTPGKCLALLPAVVTIIFILAGAHAGEYLVQPRHTVTSPDSLFVIEQRALVEEGEWAWQAWICPAKGGASSYLLLPWQGAEWCWAGDFTISPNGKYILHIQKTGSGANEGMIFTKRQDGRFVAAANPQTSGPLLKRAWLYFRFTLGVDPMLSRGGLAFVSWGLDGDCLEISLHGSDLGGGYAVEDWRLHYNILTSRFFQTPDQILHNRGTVVAPVEYIPKATPTSGQ